jgi:hypothetical protein
MRYNWPNWARVQQAFEESGVYTVWDMPSNVGECERLLGFEQGTFGIDDQLTTQNGTRFRLGSKPGLGNFYDSAVEFQIRRAAKALAGRLKTADGYRVTSGVEFPFVPTDEHARKSWHSFLKRLFEDETPARDSSGDSACFNSAYSTDYSEWDEVAIFTEDELRDPTKPRLVDLWVADSYASFVDSICADMILRIRKNGLVGPEMNTAFPTRVDVGLLAAKTHINCLYANNPEAVVMLQNYADALGKRVFAQNMPPVKALDVLPFASDMCLDGSRMVSVSETQEGAQAQLLPAFRAIPQFAPFVGKFLSLIHI